MIKILPFYPYRYKEYAESLYQALVADPFYQAMEKAAEGESSEVTTKEIMLRYFDYSMSEAFKQSALYLLEDNTCGAAVWSLPLHEMLLAQKHQDKRDFLESYMGVRCRDLYQDIVAAMDEVSQEYVEEEDWYLSITGVHPTWQGKGYGKDLLMPKLKEADETHTRVFLETFTPDSNAKFYEKLGFSVATTATEPTIGASYTLMIREPQNPE